MAHSGSIVQRFEGKSLPDEFLDILSTERADYIGFAGIVEGEDGTMTLVHQPIIDNDRLETIKQTMNESTAPFYTIFGADPDHEDDFQPYVLQSVDDDSAQVAVFLEGDFVGFDPSQDSRSQEFYVFQQYLMPKVQALFEQHENDAAKVIAELSKPFVQREILSTICSAGRCEILLVFASGQTVNMYKGDRHKKFSFGEASLSFGWEEKTATAEPPAQPKKGNLLATRPKVTGGSGSGVTPVTPGPVKADTAVATVAPAVIEGEVWVVPPPHRCTSTKDLGRFYDHYCLQRPKDFEDGAKKPFNRNNVKPAKLKKSVNVEDAVKANSIVVVEKPKESASYPEGGSPIKSPILIIPESERDAMNKIVRPKLRNLDDSSNLIMDPTKLAEELKGAPMPTAQIGDKGLAEFAHLTGEGLKLLPHTVLAGLAFELYYENAELRKGIRVADDLKKAV